MITRFYLKNYLSFREVELEFKNGLIVFSGISGAGKSVLMESILSLFGLKNAKAELIEGSIDSLGFDLEEFGLTKDDEAVFKKIQKDKSRYFLNNQTLSQKSLSDISSKFIRYIHIKDNSDFNNDNLLEVIDLSLGDDKEFSRVKEEFSSKYIDFIKSSSELNKLISEEKNIEELKEFISYEIKKIDDINPQIDEYEELSNIKKQLSQKEKIENSIEKAKGIFEYTSSVNQVLNLLETDSSFFDDAINELNNIFEKSSDKLNLLEDINIDEVLTRIEQLSHLQKKFGSIQECLEYKEQKKQELARYENISFEKSSLEKKVKDLKSQIESLAQLITLKRKDALKIIEQKVNGYLEYLYLSDALFTLENTLLSKTGCDMVQVSLKNAKLENISSGEFNRLRLGLMAVKSEYALSNSGILFLDEIDANLSGKESGAIAKVLEQISKKYQIFAISHQAQLTSVAHQHFLVEKVDGISNVYEIYQEKRVHEIARMISGDKITAEAIDFAKNLLRV
ncbi:AAA family ATPase [Arcobacter sp. FWKO B]|uniref:AAA family ATPase n=1 Tax=Arcobacter sp. FWKO B TaxID=2593672 RepID=UPI0018A64C69|nr:AAA family ATPase [Arcobacter sp. FWKO B]QOG12037.1 AAA family ATPase [Arcobacter sp. FWKO B]